MRESVLMTDAQEHAEPVEPGDAPLTEEERVSRAHADDRHGIPWVLSALELDTTCLIEEDQPKVTMEPSLIFSLTVP